MDYSRLSEEDLDDLENVPAYIRKQMKTGKPIPLKSRDYSDLTVKKGPANKIVISENNLYIHKNVD